MSGIYTLGLCKQCQVGYFLVHLSLIGHAETAFIPGALHMRLRIKQFSKLCWSVSK